VQSFRDPQGYYPMTWFDHPNFLVEYASELSFFCGQCAR
jgi:hypothetical protein